MYNVFRLFGTVVMTIIIGLKISINKPFQRRNKVCFDFGAELIFITKSISPTKGQT